MPETVQASDAPTEERAIPGPRVDPLSTRTSEEATPPPGGPPRPKRRPGPGRPPVELDLGEILRLKSQGRSVREIAEVVWGQCRGRKVRLSPSTVQRTLVAAQKL